LTSSYVGYGSGSNTLTGSSALTFDGSNLTCTGNITAYSDERLKTDVVTIQNALDLTTKLRGVRFTKDGRVNVGVIAQETQKVLPEVVIESNNADKFLSVAYGNIVGLLIEAIKELNQKIDMLTASSNSEGLDK
jgi:hypothetical protein